jgi:hypothetical protein
MRLARGFGVAAHTGAANGAVELGEGDDREYRDGVGGTGSRSFWKSSGPE